MSLTVLALDPHASTRQEARSREDDVWGGVVEPIAQHIAPEHLAARSRDDDEEVAALKPGHHAAIDAQLSARHISAVF